MKTHALPVLHYATGQGWTEVGTASTVEAARRVILKTIGDASLALMQFHSFTLNVRRRTELARELNGGPDGYIWDIGKTTRTC